LTAEPDLLGAARLGLAALALAGGAFFMLAAAIATLRLPDALSRLHGVTKAETAGVGLMLLGAVLAAPDWRFAALALLAWMAAGGTGAAASHFIARGVLRARREEDAP
jgi:Multisubunit Na+/H+ antiporter, MnhG subunit